MVSVFGMAGVGILPLVYSQKRGVASRPHHNSFFFAVNFTPGVVMKVRNGVKTVDKLHGWDITKG